MTSNEVMMDAKTALLAELIPALSGSATDMRQIAETFRQLGQQSQAIAAWYLQTANNLEGIAAGLEQGSNAAAAVVVTETAPQFNIQPC